LASETRDKPSGKKEELQTVSEKTDETCPRHAAPREERGPREKKGGEMQGGGKAGSPTRKGEERGKRGGDAQLKLTSSHYLKGRRGAQKVMCRRNSEISEKRTHTTLSRRKENNEAGNRKSPGHTADHLRRKGRKKKL